jgi:trehalose 6-phosphate phosphatase
VHTLLRQDAEGLTVEGSVEPVRLLAPGVTWDITEEGPHHVARAQVALGREPLVLELRVGALNAKVSFEHGLDRLDRTCEYWRTWCVRLTMPSLARELTMTSALVLKGLCHGPTGAIAAAPTTSLPECIGGSRNWDYRNCWLRDASMAADALAQLGSYSEGVEFLDWLLALLVRQGSLDGCQPMYSLTGDSIPYEAEISELSGSRNSRPVRIGNAAYPQLQLDTFGPVADLVWRLFRKGAPLSSQHWRLVHALVNLITRRWREPDHGIWEIRTRRRHYVHSKIMCWVTMDRACKLAAYHLPEVPREWASLRDAIHAEVMERGWDAQAGAFVMSYDGTGLDAAVLEIGLRGMVAPDDPRLLSTLAAVQRELQVDNTIRRYRHDDGLSGSEGSFLLCSSWVVRLLAQCGRRDEAMQVFEALCARAGVTGLLPEEYDPKSQCGLGNHPQAYSHIAVIESALALQQNGNGDGVGAK